jgi:hypothetical protein
MGTLLTVDERREGGSGFRKTTVERLSSGNKTLPDATRNIGSAAARPTPAETSHMVSGRRHRYERARQFKVMTV